MKTAGVHSVHLVFPSQNPPATLGEFSDFRSSSFYGCPSPRGRRGVSVSPEVPDVLEHRRDAADEFVLIASDGIWDRIGSQEAVDFVRRKLQEGGRGQKGQGPGRQT